MTIITVKENLSETYIANVDIWTSKALTNGAQDFATILKSLPGVYPAILLESVERLANAGVVPFQTFKAIQEEVSHSPHPTELLSSILPLPHPLDFEWRFTSATSERLLADAVRLSAPSDKILLLGTPGLCAHILESRTNRHIQFVGENNIVTTRLKTHIMNTQSNLPISHCDSTFPKEKASVVVIDPPWYFDYIRPIFRLAKTNCKVEGHIIATLPSIGTRPSAANDRKRTFQFAKGLGLELVTMEEGCLLYDSPFFERNALKAAGLLNLPANWRCGDLAIFKNMDISRENPISSRSGQSWKEVLVSDVRIRIRNHRPNNKIVGIESLIEGDVLSTVSRRDRRRHRVDVWTSGNRVFKTGCPNLVYDVCKALANEQTVVEHLRMQGTNIPTSVQIQVMEEIHSKIRQVVETENVELGYFEKGGDCNDGIRRYKGRKFV